MLVAIAPAGEEPRVTEAAAGAQEVRLLNHATWEPTAQLAHPETLSEGEHQGAVLYEEVEEPPPRIPLTATSQAALQQQQPHRQQQQQQQASSPPKPQTRPRWGGATAPSQSAPCASIMDTSRDCAPLQGTSSRRMG